MPTQGEAYDWMVVALAKRRDPVSERTWLTHAVLAAFPGLTTEDALAMSGDVVQLTDAELQELTQRLAPPRRF